MAAGRGSRSTQHVVGQSNVGDRAIVDAREVFHRLDTGSSMIANSIPLIVGRRVPPKPWVEGDNIPWQDPAFSERMLVEHL